MLDDGARVKRRRIQCRGSDRSRLRSAWSSCSRAVATTVDQPVRRRLARRLGGTARPPRRRLRAGASAAAPPAASPGDEVRGRQRQHPDLQRPAGRRAAPAARAGLGAADRRPRQRRGGRLPDDLRQGAARRVDGHELVRRATSSIRSGWATSSAPGYLLDLTDRESRTTRSSSWQDIVPFFRDFNATYNGKIYTIPLDGDFHMVYYRRTSSTRTALKPPATWDDYLTIAAKYNGQDLNGDGQPDYGSCIAKKKGAQSYWWIISLAAGLLQSKGTSRGRVLRHDQHEPAVRQERGHDPGPPDLRQDGRVRSARRAQHGRRRHRAACSRPGAAP